MKQPIALQIRKGEPCEIHKIVTLYWERDEEEKSYSPPIPLRKNEYPIAIRLKNEPKPFFLIQVINLPVSIGFNGMMQSLPVYGDKKLNTDLTSAPVPKGYTEENTEDYYIAYLNPKL